MRVLIVEDARLMAETLAKGLREQGYAVDLALDGERGLELAEINRYDVIVLDIMLPRRDGLSVCRALRGQGLNVPVLMLTAPSPTIEPEGSGLGLAIVKMIAELHGGRVTASSYRGKGSTFILHIPVAGSRQQDEKTVYSFAGSPSHG